MKRKDKHTTARASSWADDDDLIGEPSSSKDDAFLNAAKLASLLNLTEGRIAQLVRQGVIPKAGRALFRLADSVRAYVKYIQQTATRQDGTIADPEKLSPFLRKAHYAAERDKLKLRAEVGELIPHGDVEEGYAIIFKVVARFADTLPDIMERDCGCTSQQLAKIEERLDAMRNELQATIVHETKHIGTARKPGIKHEGRNASADMKGLG